MRHLASLLLVLGLGTMVSGCEVMRLLPQYGGIRGTFAGPNGEPVSYARIDASVGGSGYSVAYIGPSSVPSELEQEIDVSWFDFNDGKGQVPVRVVDVNFGVGGNAWFPKPGQPPQVYLRAGEFMIEHVVAGAGHVSFSGAVGAHGAVVESTLEQHQMPVNVEPDQWTTVHITVPYDIP